MKNIRTLGASTSINTDKLEGLGASVVPPPPPPPPEGAVSRGLLIFGPLSPPPPPLFLLSLSLSSLTPDILPLSPPLRR